ncbi:hypothetical protein [Streptomyces sp. NPDC001070]
MTHMILTRRFFALAAATAVVTGGALLPTTAFAAAPVARHTVPADVPADHGGEYSTLLYTEDMNQTGSGSTHIRTDHWKPGPWDPGHGDHDGDGYGGGGSNGGVHTKGGDWRKHPVCITAPCVL